MYAGGINVLSGVSTVQSKVSRLDRRLELPAEVTGRNPQKGL